MNYWEALEYLLTEQQRLTTRTIELQREFDALRTAGYPSERFASYRCQLREYCGLLQNHLIALEWTLYPPCGRMPRALIPAHSPVIDRAILDDPARSLDAGDTRAHGR